MKKGKRKWQNAILLVIMFLISMFATGVAAYFYGKSFREIFMLLIVSAASFGSVIFSFEQSNIYQRLHYDNGNHYARFVFMFIISIVAGCMLPFLPSGGWAVPAIALALTLFSNTTTGLMAYAGVLGICVYFSDASILIFLIYFLVGAIISILFEGLDEDYKTGVPMSVAVILYTVVMAAKIMFENQGMPDVELFIIPMINVFITILLMMAVLRLYCAAVIDKEKGKFLVINDQEFPLLAKYKEENEQLYYNAIHTAYFAEKAARMLHMDVNVAKCGGYYHKIIVAECRKEEKTLEEICQMYKFPPKAMQLLQEYNYKSLTLKMKETVVVYLADSVVSSIMYLLEKEHKNEIDYGKIATAIIRRKVDSGILNQSDISLSELGGMEKIFTGEKLYYDFLRRE
ncbi:MAG: hypothetical protein IJO85_12560 [Lachnospiraceae bacterium]|nr:hypothetical protein [Lachnospiraceae bacterium]